MNLRVIFQKNISCDVYISKILYIILYYKSMFYRSWNNSAGSDILAGFLKTYFPRYYTLKIFMKLNVLWDVTFKVGKINQFFSIKTINWYQHFHLLFLSELLTFCRYTISIYYVDFIDKRKSGNYWRNINKHYNIDYYSCRLLDLNKKC